MLVFSLMLVTFALHSTSAQETCQPTTTIINHNYGPTDDVIKPTSSYVIGPPGRPGKRGAAGPTGLKGSAGMKVCFMF